jgi:hypothetical protein
MASRSIQSRSEKTEQTPHTKGDAPNHRSGDHIRKAKIWGGGNKAGKGSITRADRRNPNSSAKS